MGEDERDYDIGRALQRTYEVMNIPHGEPRGGVGRSAAAARRPAATGPRTCSATAKWARRSRSFKGVPIVSGGAGNGGRAHAANEYYIIEGAGKVYGMAGAEKAVATLMLCLRRQDCAEEITNNEEQVNK